MYSVCVAAPAFFHLFLHHIIFLAFQFCVSLWLAHYLFVWILPKIDDDKCTWILSNLMIIIILTSWLHSMFGICQTNGRTHTFCIASNMQLRIHRITSERLHIIMNWTVLLFRAMSMLLRRSRIHTYFVRNIIGIQIKCKSFETEKLTCFSDFPIAVSRSLSRDRYCLESPSAA